MNLNRIFDAFPPPSFLDIPYAGVSISDTHIRCLQFSKNGKKLSLSKHTEKVLPVGFIVSGMIQDMAGVVNVLKEIKKDLNLTHIKISLPEEKWYLFTTKIPIVENKEVRGAVEFKLEENVPIPSSDLVFDYNIADAHSHSDHLIAIVSALPIPIVDKYIETVNSAGLSLLSLEIESQAIARALLPKKDSSTHLIVNLGREKVGLYVASHRIVHFTSTINMKGKPNDNLAILSQEIKKLYMYWHTLKENAGVENKKINQIFVCGEDIGEEVVPFLSLHTNTPSEVGNVWINAFDISVSVPQISFIDSLKFAPTIGLALPTDILI